MLGQRDGGEGRERDGAAASLGLGRAGQESAVDLSHLLGQFPILRVSREEFLYELKAGPADGRRRRPPSRR
jgi:hypothetical protein